MPHPTRTPAARAGRSGGAARGAAAAAAPRRATSPRPARPRPAAARPIPPQAALPAARTEGGGEEDFPAHFAQAMELALPGIRAGKPDRAAAEARALPAAAAAPGASRGWLPWRWGRLWPALQQKVARRPRRELRMAEMLTLSDKRFLAVVRYGESQFLIGGAQNSIALLSRIEPPAPAAPRHPAMFR